MRLCLRRHPDRRRGGNYPSGQNPGVAASTVAPGVLAAPVLPAILTDAQRELVAARKAICGPCDQHDGLNLVTVKCKGCQCVGLSLVSGKCKLGKWGPA